MDVLLRHLELRRQEFAMGFHLMLPLLHGEVQLILAILQLVDAIRAHIKYIAQFLHLQLECIMRNHLVLFLSNHASKLLLREISLKIEFPNFFPKCG